MSDMEFVLTPRGHEDIKNELSELLTVKRPEVIERIRQARQLGDLSENFDYEDAKRAQSIVEARIAELKAILSHASIVDGAAADGRSGSVRRWWSRTSKKASRTNTPSSAPPNPARPKAGFRTNPASARRCWARESANW